MKRRGRGERELDLDVVNLEKVEGFDGESRGERRPEAEALSIHECVLVDSVNFLMWTPSVLIYAYQARFRQEFTVSNMY